MGPAFAVAIIAPDRTIHQGTARSLVVPAARGSMGILAHHAPIVARLRPGCVTVTDETGATASYPVSGAGYLSFADNAATILIER